MSTAAATTTAKSSTAKTSLTGTTSISAANVAGVVNAPIMAPVVLSTTNGMVLTVGAGMEFATLGAALRNAVNGDTIAVKAGTYVNDFSVVKANVTIVAVGGMVNEVGTEPPPDGKGIITADASLTISGFSFTGAGTGDQYGNVAGIRYETGNLNVSYCDFHNLQDGLLATPWVSNTGTVNIDHSSFEQDGSGDGYTHDIYIGDVADFNLTNSVITSAYVGHEVKSRADVTNISHNVIADGPTGTGSYDIDIPNAGAATISDNIIEKGPDASNTIAIHYGGETQYSYATNYLNVTGNTIIDDLAGQTGIAVANQSSYNDVNVSVNMTDNQLYGFAPGNVVLEGASTQSGDTVLTTEPTFSTASPTTALPTTTVTGPERLFMTAQNQTVSGGTSIFLVNDSIGGNTIAGGSGGMQAAITGQSDLITTQAGASDTVSAAGEYDTVQSAGNDQIKASGQYQTIEASGASTVVGTQFNTYDLNGNEALLTSSDSLVDVGATARARIFNNGGDVSVTVTGGGFAGIVNDAAAGSGSVAASATISGGAATAWITGDGAISITTGNGGAQVLAGQGSVDVTGGSGPDTIYSGAGAADFTLGSGNDQVNLSQGTIQVTGGSGADTYIFHGGNYGQDTISGFKEGTDTLQFQGFANNAKAIAHGAVVNGSTILTLADGSTVDIAGVALPGYASSSGTSTSGTTTPISTAPTQPTVSGGGSTSTGPQESNGTLTVSGQSITGGASLLTIGDAVGGNTIAGGSGGVNVTAAPGDLITTAAGAADTVSLLSYDTVTGAGTDQVTANYSHDVISESGNASVSLLGANEQVTGGAGLLQVTDDVTGNTIAGGSGGVNANLSGSYDVVSTSVGATDTLTLTTQDTVTAAGNDQISISGNYNVIGASGTDVISSTSANSQYDLAGRDSLTTSGGGAVTVGGSAVDSVFSTGAGGINLTTEQGGSVAVTQTISAGTNAAATVSGAAASIMTTGGNYAGIYVTATGGDSVTAGAGPVSVTSSATSAGPADTINAGSGSLSVTTANAQIFGGSGSLVVNAQGETAGTAGVQVGAGSGNVTLNGGAGNELFTGGSGQAQIWLGGGQDTVSFGSGLTTVHGGVADVFLAPTNGGSAVILNWNAQDTLAGAGSTHATPAITAQSVVNGSTYLSFVGGGQIELAGVTHFS